MDFQRARTKEQIHTRQNDIIDACASLYREMEYDAITLKMISDRTAISRTTMYGYYKTKEEIFLDLLKREYGNWASALLDRFEKEASLTREAFCQIMTDVLYENTVLMRLLSIQQTIIEHNSSLDQLIQFQIDSKRLIDGIERGLSSALPDAKQMVRDEFIVQFLIYVLGFYPNTHPLEKQAMSMKVADLNAPLIDAREILYDGIFALTSLME